MFAGRSCELLQLVDNDGVPALSLTLPLELLNLIVNVVHMIGRKTESDRRPASWTKEVRDGTEPLRAPYPQPIH